MRLLVIAPLLVTALATAAIADEKPVQLKEAWKPRGSITSKGIAHPVTVSTTG
jgi:hypothetical protein